MSDAPTSEPTDRVPGQPDVTAWRQAARRHQSEWRELHGWPAGLQRRSKQQGGGFRPIGSRVEEDYARRTGVNFVSDAVRAAVAARLDPANRERHETLDDLRLFCDLLSSMPMCFNLFGALWADPELARAVVHRWFPGLCPPGADVEVRFEWSPGRSDERWLGDKTAFDVALLVRNGDLTTLIGIETKYHEYPVVEPIVVRKRGVERTRVPRSRYLEVTAAGELFTGDSWLERVWGSDVEQVWRDHLLAHAWQQQRGAVDRAAYVLVAPAANPAWSPLVERYREMLTDSGRATFLYRTVDDLLSSAADLHPDAGALQRRYLDVEVAR